MKRFAILFSGGAFLLLLTACHHSCPAPSSSMECYPLCVFEKKKAHADAMEDLNALRQFRSCKYIPVGNEMIDPAHEAFVKFSVRMENSLIREYFKADPSGIMVFYYEFARSVDVAARARKCSRFAATDMVLKDWSFTALGNDKCRSLGMAVVMIQYLRSRQQIAKLSGEMKMEFRLLSRVLRHTNYRLACRREVRKMLQLKKELLASGKVQSDPMVKFKLKQIREQINFIDSIDPMLARMEKIFKYLDLLQPLASPADLQWENKVLESLGMSDYKL